MSVPWWQSIRWRLALGSILVSLLATVLLVLTALSVVVYYYGTDQKDRIPAIASERVSSIDNAYTTLSATASPEPVHHRGNLCVKVNNQYRPGNVYATINNTLTKAVDTVFASQTAQDPQYLFVVLNRCGNIIYPSGAISSTVTANFLARLVATELPTSNDIKEIRNDIQEGMRGKAVVDVLHSGLIAQPVVVQPVLADVGLSPEKTANQRVIGVLIVTPRAAVERTIPPFIANVGGAVLLAAPFIALIAALVALLFARTLTRPLAKITQATTTLAAGNYDVRVQTQARGELGELARNFNEMAEQLKRDVEELHRQEAWRRELMMSITHDLATPLTAIAGLGEAMVDGVSQSREEYEATGRIIVRETLRLRRLVRDLHMMAKVEAGALHPQRRPIRLAALVDEVLAVLAPEFEKAQVEPVNAIPYELSSIEADPDMLSRVFANLCDNALHFTPGGGTVTIAARQEQMVLVVSVCDTGEGIPPEALTRVFERFFRADSARQSTTGGSGLGLAIVRAVIEAHGGRVWAENAPGAGACLNFTLPLQPSGQPSFSDADTHPLAKQAIHDAIHHRSHL